jgi:uncharacterized protein YciI/uncharacterized protein YndB with AHSA1/START domain
MPPLPPIRHDVSVSADPESAFEAFTLLSGWWPLSAVNVLGEGSLLGFDDDERLVERTVEGDEAVWGEVLDWEPGRRLRLSWHPSTEPTPPTELTLTFAAAADGTSVVLEHAGWESQPDPDGARTEYAEAWPAILSLYVTYVGATGATPIGAEVTPADAETGATWVALMHTPGPTAPAQGSLYADPRFAKHVEFLQRMQARGYLVAAGPMPDVEGAGMTILRVPGEDSFAAAVDLATIEDGAVASGLLSVSVRPWSVMFHTLD